jgi:magnesium-transporting ATPase (P-type)
MREDKISIYKFVSRVLVIFCVMVLFQTVVGSLIGDEVKIYSTMYQLGREGIAYETLLQYLLSAITTTGLNIIFFSDKILKNIMAFWRTVIMLIIQLIIVVGFIYCFDWFPVDNLVAWGTFLLIFAGSVVISLLVMELKSRSDSKKYDNLLMDYKNKQKRRLDNE